MSGLVINIDPVIIHVGHFALRWYSVFIVLAVVAAVLISARQAKKNGLAGEVIYSMTPWLLVAGIVGARLFHVIDKWSYYAANPALIFQVQQGGLAIWGALVGGAIALFAFARARHLPLARLLDVLVPGLLVAQIIGRFACIVNGDAAGSLTTLPWGFIYVNPEAMVPAGLAGVPTHPYPVYEMLWNGASLLLLLKLRGRLKADGALFFGYVGLYSLGRLALTFVRQEAVWFWGLQEAQVVSIILMAASTALLVFRLRRSRPATAAREGVSE